MALLTELFTWWNRQTLGTRLFTWRKGEQVGSDALGNTYYRERNGNRRWVIYGKGSDSSTVPPEWHGWLHHTVDETPDQAGYTEREWFRPHVPNMTGTDMAYRPPGSTLRAGERPPATGDYDAWTPSD